LEKLKHNKRMGKREYFCINNQISGFLYLILIMLFSYYTILFTVIIIIIIFVFQKGELDNWK